jgi:hypothetical protein
LYSMPRGLLHVLVPGDGVLHRGHVIIHRNVVSIPGSAL